MSEELKPCPFCGGKPRLDQRVTQSLWNSSDATFSNVTCDECDVTGQDFCDDPSGEEAIEWWNRRAQPAEAEEAEVVAYATPDEYGGWQMLFFDEKEAMLYVEENEQPSALVLHSALSSVTAERDRLRDQVKVLQSDANSWQSGYDKGRRDGTKHRQSEVDQLRAEVEALRKDKARLNAIEQERWDVRFLSSPNGDAGDSSISIEIVGHFMAEPCERVVGENYSENLRAALDQAMTAEAYPPARPEYDERGRPVRAAMAAKEV